ISGQAAVSLSPDGRWLAFSGLGAANDVEVVLWEVASGSVGQRFKGPQGYPAQALAFSPDGRLLAAGLNDGTVLLWDLAMGRECKRYTGHRGAVKSLAFAPDGARLASGSADRTGLVWDVRSPAEPGGKTCDVNELWESLVGGDAAAAHRTFFALVGQPEAA